MRMPTRWCAADRGDLAGSHKERRHTIDSLCRIDHAAIFYFDLQASPSIIRAAGPAQGANRSPLGGSEMASVERGPIIRAAGPSQGANRSPLGGSEMAKP